jgi:signal transduction histidine kinase
MHTLRRTFKPLRRMGWALFLSLAYVIATWLLLPGLLGDTEEQTQLRNNIITSAGDFLGVIWCLSGLWTIRKQLKKSKRLPWATLTLATGCLSLGIADSIWAWLEHKGLDPFPSSADFFSLGLIPLVLLSVLLLPAHKLPSSQRMRILLDGLVGLTALFTFSWRFLISPTILDESKVGLTAKAVGIAYPIGDLLLGACLMILMVRAGRTLRGAGLTYIALGIAALLVADSFFLFLTLQGTYQSGTALDLLWPICCLCLGLGGRSLALHMASNHLRTTESLREESTLSTPWRTAIPYLLVPFSGIFFFSTLLEHQDQTLEMIGMCISGAMLVGLILLRQFVALQDNWQLVRQSQEDAKSLKSLNAELRATQAELVHSAKMASLGTLSAGVAHELNQPIAIVRGISQQLQEEPGLTKFVLEDLQQIEKQTGRMMRIINHLRTFCRTEGHDTSSTPIASLIDNCMILIGAQLKARGVAVSVQLPDEPSEVYANANEIEQILLNLVTNARDALEGHPQPELTLTIACTSEYVILECADNGPGIAPGALAHLFEPFFTTKEVGKGMGLGLSISENLARKNGGSLSARTEDGAVFTLKLPRAKQNPESVSLPLAA